MLFQYRCQVAHPKVSLVLISDEHYLARRLRRHASCLLAQYIHCGRQSFGLHLENLLHRLEADRHELALQLGIGLAEPPLRNWVVDDDAIPLQHGWKIAFGTIGHEVSFPLFCNYRRAAAFSSGVWPANTESTGLAPSRLTFAVMQTTTGTKSVLPQDGDVTKHALFSHLYDL